MFDTYHIITGYDLYEVFEDRWVIDLKGFQAFHGSFQEVVDYMVKSLGFDKEVLGSAVSYLFLPENEGHNCMHFGVRKTFLFTSKKEIDEEKAS